MYDVNSGGAQPCDTISKHAGKAPISISGRYLPARMSGSPHARPSIVRPGPRPAAAPVHGSGARDPATRAEDPGPSRGTGPPPRPPSPLAETRKVPGRYRPGAVRLYYQETKRAKRPLVPCQRVSWMSRTCTRWLSRLNYCVDDDVRGVLDVDRL